MRESFLGGFLLAAYGDQKCMDGCERRGTSSVSVVRNSEGPLLGGWPRFSGVRNVLLLEYFQSVPGTRPLFGGRPLFRGGGGGGGVRYGGLHCIPLVTRMLCMC